MWDRETRYFVVSPHGRTLLIDGGGAFGGFPGREEHNGIDPGEEAVSPYLWSRGFQKLDVVALTHAHQDHIGGLTAILENFRVGTLWIGREVESGALGNLEQVAREKKIPIVHEVRGKPFSWDEVESEFLWPEIGRKRLGLRRRTTIRWCCELKYGEREITAARRRRKTGGGFHTLGQRRRDAARGCVEGWSSRQQELDDAAFLGCRASRASR